MNWNWTIISSLAVLVAGVGLFSWNRVANAQSAFEQRYPNLPKDALERRTRSMAKLKSELVPLNEWLPTIEAEGDVKPRVAREVVLRAVSLLAVALKGEGLEKEHIDTITNKFQIALAYSPKEKAFIDAPSPSETEKAANSWRYEAAYILFWALGYAETPSAPRTPHDPAALVTLIKAHNLDQLISGAKLKSTKEILDQADLIYRYRWALVDARVKGIAAPAGLNDDVAMEQHQALNWLIRYMDEDWDDISLDT